MAAKKNKRTVNKSAKTGKFVSNALVKFKPTTTFKETVRTSSVRTSARRTGNR